jgi:hypothetical protein
MLIGLFFLVVLGFEIRVLCLLVFEIKAGAPPLEPCLQPFLPRLALEFLVREIRQDKKK